MGKQPLKYLISNLPQDLLEKDENGTLTIEELVDIYITEMEKFLDENSAKYRFDRVYYELIRYQLNNSQVLRLENFFLYENTEYLYKIAKIITDQSNDILLVSLKRLTRNKEQYLLKSAQIILEYCRRKKTFRK